MPGPRRPSRVLMAGALAAGVALGGCASFPDAAPPQAWQAQPQLTARPGPQPQIPGEGGEGGGSSGNPPAPSRGPTQVPPPNGCQDFHAEVVGTCLNTVSAVAVLPDGNTGLVAERTTGRVLRVARHTDPVVVATIPVDASGGGGLTGLSLSPTYEEDQLVFAYVTTPADNRVVRFAPGDAPKPVLTGIPRGATDNAGALTVDRRGALLVATGDAGNPAAAANPGTLAGKVLRIDGTGHPAPGNPTIGSPVVASGLHAPQGICTSADGTRSWVTDRAPDEDVLYRLALGQPLDVPAWTWPDRPGVAGCASFSDSVVVATEQGAAAQALLLNRDGSFNGKPVVAEQNTFGRLFGMDTIGDQKAWVGTVNRSGGQPVSSDDRVFELLRPSPVAGGKD
nr:PQQ-dependent sugar dehydrogenase [Gandjariella thermophila]